MKIASIIIISLFIAGCSSPMQLNPPVITPNPINISAEALEPCPLLNEDLIIETFDDLVTEYSNLAVLYSVCAGKQAASIKLLKYIGNTK